MRKKSLVNMQSFIQASQREVNQAVFEFKQLLDAEEWNRLRQRARSTDEQRAMDEACVSRYRLLKKLGLVVYDKEKRVMTIARLDIL
jgi:hypothetical protein